jgi:beta-lactam-binding protein with PASTA domain
MRLRLTLAVLMTVGIAGCGGGADGPVPDVVGSRLDVAKSEMADAGYETEEIGGGMFGIVNESNWTVCETRPAAGSSASDKVKLIVDRSCGTSPAASADEGTEQDVDDVPQPELAPRRVRVPNVIGMDHQAAQNRMQDVGLFFLRERDATGQGRLLVWDRNWTVVDQRPRAGSRVSEDRPITLYSVKDDEL